MHFAVKSYNLVNTGSLHNEGFKVKRSVYRVSYAQYIDQATDTDFADSMQ